MLLVSVSSSILFILNLFSSVVIIASLFLVSILDIFIPIIDIDILSIKSFLIFSRYLNV